MKTFSHFLSSLQNAARIIFRKGAAPCLAVVFLTHSQSNAQVFFEREPLVVLDGWYEGEIVTTDQTKQQTYKHPGWRARMLSQFPDADANGDGALTETEAIQFHMNAPRVFTPHGRELELLPEGTTRWTARVPMRDGETLPTEIYLPPGQGPWPVVLLRSSRGRIDSALDYGNELLRHGYAVVGQDVTPKGDFVDQDQLGREVGDKPMTREERASFNARRFGRDARSDGYDAIKWLNEQAWVDGIAVNGYSEGSFQSKSAMSTNPPGLDLVVSAIGTLSRTSRGPIGMPSGGRVSWNGDIPSMPASWKPNDESNSFSTSGEVVKQAKHLKLHLNDRTGWFDFAVQGAIDEWVALKDHGRATLIMGIGGHGALSEESRQAPAYGDCDLLFPEIDAFDILRGKNIPQKSRLFYFLMGDATNPQAPGNQWKVTETWPISHEDQSWYFHMNGFLVKDKPAEERAFVEYTYDPNDPVTILSGARLPARHHGPRDHGVLRNRSDILSFDTEPLGAPVEITGEASIDLYFSTDVPDTSFVVTVVDIYPDGYEWPIRDTAIAARYYKGLESPEKLVKDQIYHAHLPLVATALMVDKGHRIGVRVSSSSFPAYAIHPNTWDAIDSYNQAKVARQKIHTSGKWASRLTLPVVSPGVSVDYDPHATY